MIAHEEVLVKLRFVLSFERAHQDWAQRNGFSASYLSMVLRGHRQVNEALALKLGYKPVTMYEMLPVDIGPKA